ncbi:hypothetical protein J6590_037793 [Homalodisca vitripennis]|nr:hypothetical protein J6590_037793 [Homalodisca vitripennis]
MRRRVSELGPGDLSHTLNNPLQTSTTLKYTPILHRKRSVTVEITAPYDSPDDYRRCPITILDDPP